MQAADEAEVSCRNELNIVAEQLTAADEELAKQSGTQPASSMTTETCLGYVWG